MSRFDGSFLKARRRSKLGAFVAGPSKPIIFTVPVYMDDSISYVVTGTNFGASQGSGSLIVSDTLARDNISEAQTIVSWSDTSITFTFDATNFSVDQGIWITVINSSGASDSKMSYIGGILSDPITIGGGTRTALGDIGTCDISLTGLDPCGVSMEFSWWELREAGLTIPYLDALVPGQGDPSWFFENQPGFILTGQTSGKTATLYTYDDYQTGLRYIYCGQEGLQAVAQPSTGDATLLLDITYSTAPTGTCATDGTGGWTSGETVSLVPLYPSSIGFTSPLDRIAFTSGGGFEGTPPWWSLRLAKNEATNFALSASAFDETGDIGDTIEWALRYPQNSPTASDVGTGKNATVTFSLSDLVAPIDQQVLEVSVLSANGQSKFFRMQIFVHAVSITRAIGFGVFGNAEPEAGGTTVTLVGEGFTTNTTVKFDGNLATSVTWVDVGTLTCVTPSGSGVVDVLVTDGADTDTLVGGYTYSASDVIVSLCTPNSGDSSGGTAVTIGGFGFNSDCDVYFDGVIATSIVYVDANTITCVTPAGTGTVDVKVIDPVASPNAEYTSTGLFEYGGITPPPGP
mgnify:CR=1 FL=1